MSVNHSKPPESVMNQLQDGGGFIASNLSIYNYEPLMKRDEDICHNRGCAPVQSILSVYSTCLLFYQLVCIHID